MGAKKRSTAVDRQQRSGQVKTRLAANKTGIPATPNKKPQKVNPKTASKKSLPIKKRISTEKCPVEESKEPKSRSNSKSKKPENEPSTSTDAAEERKSAELSPELETDSKQTAKDGKTKAISKMLKSLDIQISGFANILPPEEKIIEVLKSSISENVKTKSRAAAVKQITNSAATASKSGGRKEQTERKSNASVSSSTTNSPSTSGEQDSKTLENKPCEATSKKDASAVDDAEKPEAIEVKPPKEPVDPAESKVEEPVVETKKKLAAKKAKLEASRNKKKAEEPKEEPKPEIAAPIEGEAANEAAITEVPKEEVDGEKKKPTKSAKGAKQTGSAEKEQPVANPEPETSPPETPQKPLPKAAMSPKKSKQITKVTKGKCNEEETKVPEALVSDRTQPTADVSDSKSVVAEEASETVESNQEPSETVDAPVNSPKTTKATIHQRLQNKYKMTPVKSKPPAKPTKKAETKSAAKKPPAKNQNEEKKNDIYDFKSGSESEDNIKMELPTLKQLREFSDDDDKPLQVAKKKLKEEAKSAETVVPKPEPKVEPPKVEKKDTKPPPKAPAEKKPTKAAAKKPPAKVKLPPPESSSEGKSSSTSDSEDEQKLSTFGQKRHRMASLNALAKVQCLYENESRTAYELGLSKTVQVIPKIRTLNSESSSEDEKDAKVAIKAEPPPVKEPKKEAELKVEPVEPECVEAEKEEEVEVETKRELRNVPGRGMGKHWEFESDTDNEAIMIEKLRMKKKKLQKLKALQAKKEKKDKEKAEEKSNKSKKAPVKPAKKCVKVKAASSDDGSSESSDHEDKKKPMNPPAEKPPAEPKKKRKRELKEELIGDYKGILARKRMASLNASAIVAATYEVERHLDRNFASDCSSFESFPEEEKHVSKKSKKHIPPPPQAQPPTVQDVKETKDTKAAKDITDFKVDVSECADTKEASDFKEAVKESKESTRPTSSSLLIVQDTDVTITGVYVNPTTGSSQEAYCKMQYRVQSSVTEERVLRPGSVEPPKSYTPLGALSSMRPPGAAPGSDGRSTPPTPVTAVPNSADSINHPSIYQPNDLSHHDPSEHSLYSYHHHMSPSGMSMHPHSADHASQMHHYGGHQATAPPPPPPQAPSAHHYHTQQQQPPPTSMSQGRCESPGRYTGSYQGQHPTLSMTAGGGSSAFCAPPSLQQQQQLQHQQHHDMSGYYQPAGPLISPHVLPSVAAAPPSSQQSQSNISLTGLKGKQIPTPLDSDPERGQLQPPPSSTSTVESSDSDVLITGGDLTTFRYPAQQLSTQQSANVASQQQQSQQQLHQQAAAAAAAAAAAHQSAPPYPRSMHQMHYTSAYPPNYYSPYPGEAMCYSPSYQPYFSAKVYQSAPPPPSYRRYPPYYQPGPPTGPPPPSDIYEQSPPSSGQPPPTGPPTGTQLVPAGPGAAHTQHLEHYPGPPGYYSAYSPGGGGQCYTRSPYMEYPPQCPCPMQQSCPKNVHTGPHIGSNTSSGSNNNSSSSNNNSNNTSAPITTNSSSNPTVAITATMAPAASANIATSANNVNNKSSVTPNSMSSNNNVLPVSAMLNSSETVNANISSNQQQQLNIGRGPVTKNNSNPIHQQQQQLMMSDGSVGVDTVAPTAHHHFLHHTHHHPHLRHHHVQSCDEIDLLKPLKSELKSEDIDVDSKSSQYEEEVIQPPTPPLNYEKSSEGLTVSQDNKSEKTGALNGQINCPIEAFDLTMSVGSPPMASPTPPVVARKARIGKTMAREMVYAGAAAIHNPARLQQMQSAQQPTLTQLQHSIGSLAPVMNSPSHLSSNKIADHNCEGTVPLILKTKIKSEQIKTEKEEDMSVLLPDGEDAKEQLSKIKMELEIIEDTKVSTTELDADDDDIEITSPALDGPKQRIKILESYKSQCKKSPPNSYKSLIKQTEPKSYLCLSRKIEKRNRYGKFNKSSKDRGVRRRQLILTDQQRKSLRMRKKTLAALERKKQEKIEKRQAKRLEKRQALRREKQKSILFKSNQSTTSPHEATSDLVSRGYFSEPETRCASLCSTTGRKVRKSKTAEVRSKSETKKPSPSLLKTERWLPATTSSTSTKSGKNPSASAEKSRSHKKGKSGTTVSIKKISKKKGTHSSNATATQANPPNVSTSPTSSDCECVDQNRLTDIPDNSSANNNNTSEANNNDCSKSPHSTTNSETSIEATRDTDHQPSSNAASLPVPQPPIVDFVFRRPAIPRYISRQHGPIKRIRSRSKFGCRKRQKHKHSISIEVDETIQPTRPDVVPKWNNGWRWEGEPFQGAVFLNSDDPHVIRTCYPAMRHSEGDIIRPRDCVLLKANEDNELPYVAKVAHLWENPEDGEMMMSLLWYYRPEHTEQGRQRNDSPDEVYASRHRDHNSVACIEDKCYVLSFREYCRYRRRLRAAEEDIEDVSIVPKRPNYFNPRMVPDSTNPELVMFCRRAYEFRTKRLLKMPNKHDYVTRSSN